MKNLYLLTLLVSWMLVSCVNEYLPVNQLDEEIIEQVKAKFPGVSVSVVRKYCNRLSNVYEVKLLNGVKIKFDDKHQIIEIDESEKNVSR